jgi:hypothetical protein
MNHKERRKLARAASKSKIDRVEGAAAAPEAVVKSVPTKREEKKDEGQKASSHVSKLTQPSKPTTTPKLSKKTKKVVAPTPPPAAKKEPVAVLAPEPESVEQKLTHKERRKLARAKLQREKKAAGRDAEVKAEKQPANTEKKAKAGGESTRISHAAAVAVAPSPVSTLVAELGQLNELHRMGALSAAEFSAAKAVALARHAGPGAATPATTTPSAAVLTSTSAAPIVATAVDTVGSSPEKKRSAAEAGLEEAAAAADGCSSSKKKKQRWRDRHTGAPALSILALPFYCYLISNANTYIQHLGRVLKHQR